MKKISENEDKDLKILETDDKISEESKTEQVIYVSKLKTTKVLINELYSLENIKILVLNPELVDPGFFSSKYYQFVVNTHPVN